MIKPDEKKLVARLKARDRKAFAELVRRYQRPVFTVLFRMIGNREEAEDLTQEVFVTVFKKIDGFRGDASLATWIFRISTNHCRNRQKYLNRRPAGRKKALDDLSQGEHLGVAETTVAAHVDRPDEAFEGNRLEVFLQRAIGDLDDEQREVLVLRDIQSMTYEEICEVTGLALGTVKSRLHRGRMALKAKLAEYQR